jgi:hypothetical protein
MHKSDIDNVKFTLSRKSVFTDNYLQEAYSLIGNRAKDLTLSNYSNKGHHSFWCQSSLPITLPEIWSLTLNETTKFYNVGKAKGSAKDDKQFTICHHPFLCELSLVKKGHKNKSSKASHTCCRPSHLIPAHEAFNTMNTGLSTLFGTLLLEGKDNNKDAIVQNVLKASIDKRKSLMLTHSLLSKVSSEYT